MLRTTLILLLLSPFSVGSGFAREPVNRETPASDDAPVRVMVLGTFHFEGAPATNDILAPEQQVEIRAIADSLAEFRPTKIALELVPRSSARLDSLYRAYRAGRHDLDANERQQLGFRLAERLGHPRVYAIDHKAPWPNRMAIAWAREHRPSFLEYYETWREQRRRSGDSLHRHATLGEFLRQLNRRESLEKLEELQMRKLELGAGPLYPGVAPVLSMQKRDLHIFANLTRVVEPGDRVLVIYGTGHVYHLRDFVRNHPHMRLIDPLEYL